MLPESVAHPNKIVQIVFMVLGGLFIIIGAALIGDVLNNYNACQLPRNKDACVGDIRRHLCRQYLF